MSNHTHTPETEAQAAGVVDDQVSDVLPESEIVHVAPATEDLMDSMGHPSTFVAEVPNWDEPEHP